MLDQSRPPDELLIVDDCSTDDSVRIIEKYLENPKIRFWKNESNRGVIPNQNFLLDQIESDYVYFPSSDDRVFPGFFSRSMDLLGRNPEAGLCCTHPAHIRAGTEVIEWLDGWYRCGERDMFLDRNEAARHIGPGRFWVQGHTSILKTSLVKKYGMFDPELKWHADWFLFHVIALRHGFCYIPKALAAWRVSPDTYSTAGRRNPSQQANVLLRLVDILKKPECEDIRAIFLKLNLLEYFPEYYPELLKELDPASGWVTSRNLREKIEILEQKIQGLEITLETYNRLKRSMSFLRPFYRLFFRDSGRNGLQ